MTKHILIEGESREKVVISLVGVEYAIQPPKVVAGLLLATPEGASPKEQWEGMKRWIKMTFGSAQGEKVIARLGDASDVLDLPHIIELMNKLTELATGNPTTSSNDSSE